MSASLAGVSRAGLERVEQALARAHTIARAAEHARAELAASSHISEKGVDLALTHSLERSATKTELESLVAAVTPRAQITLILSAGVFVGAFRAVLLALAASPRVVVRPSRRDPVFARIVARTLADLGVTLAEALEVSAITEGELHVYGRDETIRTVKEQARVPVIGKGAGFGVAYIGHKANLTHAATDLALAMTLFDQRGCLSPRATFVAGDLVRAEAFSTELSRALEAIDIPRGSLSLEERGELVRFCEEAAFSGTLHENTEHVIGHFARFRLAPVGRAMSVIPVADETAMLAGISPQARFVTTIGVAGETLESSSADLAARGVERPRIGPIGRMQSPPLDGPADPRASREYVRVAL